MTNDNKIDIDALLASLKAGTKTTTTEAPKLGTELKDALKSAFDDVAKEHGVKPETIASEIVVAFIAGLMLRRAVKQGNVPKTLYWIYALANMNASYRARHLRQTVKRHG